MNRELKSIASNTAAQLVAKFFGASLTLLTTYYTIHLAGLELFGDYTKIVVLVAVGFTMIDFGLNADAIRHSQRGEAMMTNFRQLLLARLFLSGVVVGVLNIIIHLLPGGYSPAVKSVFWLASVTIVCQGIYTSANAWFQYHLAYWGSTIAVLVGSLVSTLLTLLFLVRGATLFNVILAYTLGGIAMALVALLLLPRVLTIHLLHDWRWSGLRATLRRSLALGAILVASILASKMDTIVMGIYRSSAEVGQYGFAYRVFDVLLVFPIFIMNALYPLLVKSKTELLQPTLWFLAGTGVVAGFLSYALAPLIIYIRPGMELAIISLRILVIALPLFYVTAPLMWQLIVAKRDRVVFFTYLGAAAANLLGNLLVVPRYGAPAAAITTGLTELCILLSLLYFSHTNK
jgi:O-antigen/teichoic acid export membrane protein